MDTNDFFTAEANGVEFEEFCKAIVEDNAKRFSDEVVAKIKDDSNTMDVFMRMFHLTEDEAFGAVIRQNARIWDTGFEMDTVFGGAR